LSYCEVSDVRTLTGVPETSEWDTRITNWIQDSTLKIEKRLGQTFTEPIPRLIKHLCALLTAITVLERLKAEGSLDAFTLGEYREDPLSAVESAIKNYRAEAGEIFRLYRTPIIKSSDYEYIDEDE